MKRKKWREEEEATLIREYAALLSPPSGSALLLARLRTREKKFQPIADRVNAAHHLRDPVAFPFRWSWRDVSVKIHNMRHQFLHVKRKLLPLPAHLHPDHALHLWPNFLLYKQVFGDHLDPHLRPSSSKTRASDGDREDDDTLNEEDYEYENDGVEEEDEVQLATDLSASDREVADNEERIDAELVHREEEEEEALGLRRHLPRRRRGKKMGFLGTDMVRLGEIAMRREERRREREASREEEDRERERRERALEHQRQMDEEEERREQWRRRMSREERREEEEMEWRERMLVMQMEHEKQVMQMQADAFQDQMQMIAILVRVICQFLGGATAGGGDGGIGGIQHHVMQQQQQQQQKQEESPESLVGNSGKNGDHSGGRYT
ncbi:hypothetical protein BHE74_00051735 [Ensete ventricosum]|nr:hypothetical protein GW17_00054133 [Ensete ventricosum]RWW42683.1 hypothetical protein BHE74_00051735 [Ensete ventricosum]